MSEFRLLINGELVPGASSYAVIDPATERPFAQSPRADVIQMEAAIESADRAFALWKKTTVETRRELLSALAASLEDNGKYLGGILMSEVGKPPREARMEVASAVAVLRYFADIKIPVERLTSNSGATSTVFRKPLGVVVGITPWNMPLVQACVKIGSAVSTGNTIVLKPAPTTPLSALVIGKLASVIFPPGVINIITDQHDLAPLMTSHEKVAKIGFTGSTGTARKIMSACAPTLKRLTMELGGSDAAIVLRDADMAKAAQILFKRAMYNSGQICTAPKRVYVQRDHYDEFVDALIAQTDTVKIGAANEDGVTMGPLQNRTQFEKVVEYLEDAKASGVVVTGGAPMARVGYFVPPTIVRDVTNGTRIVDEEQFGPILPVIPYENNDEVLELANANPFGLGGSVWSRDVMKAREFASQLECGQAWINNHGFSPAEFPLSGAKQSGFGVELGDEGIKSYTQMTVVCD